MNTSFNGPAAWTQLWLIVPPGANPTIAIPPERRFADTAWRKDPRHRDHAVLVGYEERITQSVAMPPPRRHGRAEAA